MCFIKAKSDVFVLILQYCIVGCDTCRTGEYNDGCNDCSCQGFGDVLCTAKECETPGEPFCKPNCEGILCANPTCRKGEQRIVPAGQCCPTCVDDPDCSNVICGKPLCLPDEIAVTRPDKCCPDCVPIVCEIEPPTPTCSYVSNMLIQYIFIIYYKYIISWMWYMSKWIQWWM